MPCQTLPIFFNFHLSAIISSPLSILHQEEADMESVDAVTALKSSFRPEIEGMKTTPHHYHHHHHHHHHQQQQQQSLNDEVFGADELDGFLDFSNEDVNEFLSDENQEEEKEVEEEEEKEWSCDSVLSTEDTHLGSKTLESNSKNDFEPQLCVPTDDLAQLEWLSHFVEDSFSKFPSFNDSVSILRETPIPNEGQKSDNSSHSPQTESKENRTGCLALTMETPVPAKARSKRSRTGGRVWFNKTHFTESSPTSSSSSSSCSSSSSSSFLQSSPSSSLIFASTAQNQDLFDFLGKPPGKKPKKEKKRPAAASDNTQLQTQRRCSHCLVQKTPQWRTGPHGAKTLCNACGVRYKSGRLLPEYRPAGSPTFLSNVHSNSHRKVLEMRRKKEVAGPEPCPLAVQSF